MRDPNTDAKRRAEAERARRLAATLSQPADQDRLKRYADELEGKIPKQDAPASSPSIGKSESDRRPRSSMPPRLRPALVRPISRSPLSAARGRCYIGPVNKPRTVPHLEAVEMLPRLLLKNASGFLDQSRVVLPGF
jgi:hypothetical protein